MASRGAETLRTLAGLGASFVVLGEGDKRPTRPGWQKRGRSLAEAEKAYKRGRNAGLLTGAPSARLCVLDVDAGWERFRATFPELCRLIVVRTNAPDRAKVVLRLTGTGAIPRYCFWLHGGHKRLEWLGSGARPDHGRNAVVAGTYEGGEYELHGDAPAEITPEALAALWLRWTGEAWVDVPRAPESPPESPNEPLKAVEGDLFGAIDSECLARGGRRRGSEIEFLCPSHPDTHASAAWNRHRHGGCWFCHGCGAKGGWRDLARRLGLKLPGPAERVRASARAWRADLEARAWRGVSGQIARAAGLYIIGEYERTGQRTRRFSVRVVADAVGVSKTGAHRALRRLALDVRLIRCTNPAAGLAARTYTLSEFPSSVGQNLSTALPSGQYSDSVPTMRETYPADIWRNVTGLGTGAKRLWEALVASKTGLGWSELLEVHPTRSTVERWLRALVVVGLAVVDGRGRYRGVPADADGLARIVKAFGMRADGAGARQRQRHQRQREVYVEMATHEAEGGARVDKLTGEVVVEAPVSPIVWALTGAPEAAQPIVAWLIAAQMAAQRRDEGDAGRMAA